MTSQESTYFQSLTREMDALRDRVRSFIHDQHWPTDGEWKESVLRTFLRRNLPENVAVGRGFIIGKNGASTQLDVLLYDRSYPVLFRDGDLVFVTPDAVVGVVEVKSRITTGNARLALEKLASLADLTGSHRKIFALFGYEIDCRAETILETFRDVAQKNERRVVAMACLGADHLIDFWYSEPVPNPAFPRRTVRRWHLYSIQNQAPGYFLTHLIRHTATQSVDENLEVWYPQPFLEGFKVAEVCLNT